MSIQFGCRKIYKNSTYEVGIFEKLSDDEIIIEWAKYTLHNNRDNIKIIYNKNQNIKLEKIKNINECNYLNNIKEVGEIVNKINNSHIKMMVDIGNCIMENDNIENIYYYKDIINHIHISMPFMNTFDNYNTKIYTKLLGILKEINYNKIVSLEFINNNVNRLENLNISLSNFVNLLN